MSKKTIISEMKKIQSLITCEEYNSICIYKFIANNKNGGLSIKAMINQSLKETLIPIRELIKKISCEILNSYDLYNLNLDLYNKNNVELFYLYLEYNEDMIPKLTIDFNNDYINFFDKRTFNDNDTVDMYITEVEKSFDIFSY